MLAHIIDKGREALHKVTEKLGEGSGFSPQSLKKERKARHSLNLDLPSIASILPYESVDEALFFINKQSIGFGLLLTPLTGADESIVKSMSEMLKNKLPNGVDCTIMLYRHHHVERMLKKGFEPMMNAGGIFEVLAKLSMDYHLKAAISGYPNGRNMVARPSDYQVFLFFSSLKSPVLADGLKMLRESIESELTVMGFGYLKIGREDFLTLMRALINPQLDALHWQSVHDDEQTPLSHLIPKGNSLLNICDASIDVEGSDDDGHPFHTRIINCHIEKWPNELALWQMPDAFASMLEPQHGIPCSFLISMTIRGVSQEKMLSRAKVRAKSLNANANAVQTFLNPGVTDERQDWNFIHEEGSRGNLALLPVFYNVMLFVHPDDERNAVAKTISSYRQLGFELQQSRATQWLQYLSSLPFFMTEGFFNDMKILGLTKTLTHHTVANLMPVVASYKGSTQGLCLPTHRHQISFFDTFDNKALPITNFNFLTIGSTGAGKSMFQQAQILSGLSLGEITYVIDLGDSYKHLCELVGGTYIDVANITLNPFTLFDFDGKTELQNADGQLSEVADNVQIRDLLAIMASPETPISDVQKSYLLDAASHCWKTKGKQANMDDVLDALNARIHAQELEDIRLHDLVILLSKYGTKGVYGHLFNGETPLVNKSKFVVFEMGGFQDNPDLLKIVMFVMIVIIQGQFYQTDRRVKKRCLIDEAWRFLTKGSNPIAANFIEQGFRTARKHNGGFGVCTQFLLDTEGSIQGKAIAASSDIKIIMRQGDFSKYVHDYPERFTHYQQKMIESFGDVAGSGFSNLMIEAGNTYSFHRYFADPFTRILFSSSGKEFSAIEAMLDEGVPLVDAVKQVARTFYGDDLV